MNKYLEMLKEYNGEKVKLGDEEWEFQVDFFPSGYLAFLSNGEDIIYATPNYDKCGGTPIEYHKVKEGVIKTSFIKEFPTTWRDYLKILVKGFKELKGVKESE